MSFAPLGHEPPALLTVGTAIKQYPCCYGAHCAAQGVLDLVGREKIDPTEVERVRVTVDPRGLTAMPYRRPRTGVEGKFSLEYVVAASLLDGGLRLETFTDAAVQRPAAQALLRRVETAEEEGEPTLRHRALVEIGLEGGRRHVVRVDKLRGAADLPLSDAEIETKVRSCISFARDGVELDGFLSAVWGWRDRPIARVVEAMRR